MKRTSEAGHPDVPDPSLPGSTRPVVTLLSVNGLVKTFGGFTAVSKASFDVDDGEIVGLIGPNGSGKSTIFNCIAGMYVPTAGSVTFGGEEIGGLPASSSSGPMCSAIATARPRRR